MVTEWQKKKGGGERENNGGDDPNWGTIYVYMKMSQWNPLYNYHILTKTFKTINKKCKREGYILLHPWLPLTTTLRLTFSLLLDSHDAQALTLMFLKALEIFRDAQGHCF
jgi:hypothetical protein